MSKGLTSVLERIEKISLGPVQFDFLEKEDLENFLKELIRHDENTFIVVDELTLFLTILSMGKTELKKWTLSSTGLKACYGLARLKSVGCSAVL